MINQVMCDVAVTMVTFTTDKIRVHDNIVDNGLHVVALPNALGEDKHRV
jgi:hypothetical protein